MIRIRNILATFLLGFWATLAAAWSEGTIFGAPTDNAKIPIGLFVRYDGIGTVPDIAIPAGQWVTIDLADGPAWCRNGDCATYQPRLPQDVKAVFLSGLLIITYPSASPGGVCDLWANFRAPGSDLPDGSYQIQTIEATGGAGQRSNAAVWVPVVDRKFEVFWYYTRSPLCPSLINLSIQAYIR